MININPLFEALQYFHRRAEGRLVRIELDRLCTRFPSKTNEFLRLLSPVADLQDRLDYLVRVGKRELSQLLTPVCSSPTPFACSNSIMYMMVFPAIRDGIDPENFTEYIYSKTDEDIMVDILSVLESPGTATVTEEITSDVFYERLENTGLLTGSSMQCAVNAKTLHQSAPHFPNAIPKAAASSKRLTTATEWDFPTISK